MDRTSHAGMIILGAMNVFIDGKLAARKGDVHTCPMSDGPKPHVGGVITEASKTVKIGNAYAARVGDLCGCSTAGVSGQGVPAVVGSGDVHGPQGDVEVLLEFLQNGTVIPHSREYIWTYWWDECFMLHINEEPT